jgi:shikimate kinase
MAAGKTTVGRVLAVRLGWRFLDVDEAIERETGRSIADIFQSEGEAAFRSMEARRTADLLSERDAVIAPGGGWAAEPGVWEGVPVESLTVWLRVSAEEAVRRAQAGGVPRPLLAGGAALATARELIAVREASYRRADLIVDVDGRDPADIAIEIETHMRTG